MDTRRGELPAPAAYTGARMPYPPSALRAAQAPTGPARPSPPPPPPPQAQSQSQPLELEQHIRADSLHLPLTLPDPPQPMRAVHFEGLIVDEHLRGAPLGFAIGRMREQGECSLDVTVATTTTELRPSPLTSHRSCFGQRGCCDFTSRPFRARDSSVAPCGRACAPALACAPRTHAPARGHSARRPAHAPASSARSAVRRHVARPVHHLVCASLAAVVRAAPQLATSPCASSRATPTQTTVVSPHHAPRRPSQHALSRGLSSPPELGLPSRPSRDPRRPRKHCSCLAANTRTDSFHRSFLRLPLPRPRCSLC